MKVFAEILAYEKQGGNRGQLPINAVTGEATRAL